MTQSNEIKNLLAALVEVQSELPTMTKGAFAGSGNYGYKYADLDTITQTIKPILAKHKIGYMQGVGCLSDGTPVLTTRIFDVNGEYIEETAALPVINTTKNNAAQVLGMSITYMRRYALCAMLGITSDEDTDANPKGGNAPKSNGGKQNPPSPPKPQLKGGDATPEEKKRIQELLESKYDNGTPVFSRDEKLACSEKRKTEMTAAELITFIENALNNRRPPKAETAPAQEFKEDIPWEQETKEDIF